MLLRTLDKANALQEERKKLEVHIEACNEWINGLKSESINTPYQSFYNKGNTVHATIDRNRFILLVQVERAEAQARLAHIMDEFDHLQDDEILSLSQD